MCSRAQRTAHRHRKLSSSLRETFFEKNKCCTHIYAYVYAYMYRYCQYQGANGLVSVSKRSQRGWRPLRSVCTKTPPSPLVPKCMLAFENVPPWTA